ncbi:hypothetical protein CLV30_106155 [Haloactinopolyspora alba]|uniref:Uncharacterized protein n=1 Tax=Haloactinopolyspora alba TaxID=648780 RepID=A0A2P8E3V8_9ACTN|nr:hypothetical protein [Haloactinopolyspora alba]PSL04150.1 hypothetical protein CLV30_106155 [Haloactinopolyspora alba]
MSNGGNISIKYGDKKDDFHAPWLTIGGEDVHDQRLRLIAAFGWNAAELEGQTLAQLVVRADQEAKGLYKLRNDLGATVVSTPQAPAVSQAGAAPIGQPPASDDPWAQAQAASAAADPAAGAGQAPAQAQPQTLMDKVKAANTVRELQMLWRDNKAEWEADAAIGAAAKERKAAIA